MLVDSTITGVIYGVSAPGAPGLREVQAIAKRSIKKGIVELTFIAGNYNVRELRIF